MGMERINDEALFTELRCPNCGRVYEYAPSVVVKGIDLGDNKVAHVVKCPHCKHERNLTNVYDELSDIASYVELLMDIGRKVCIDRDEFWAVYSQQDELHRRKMLTDLDVIIGRRVISHRRI